MDASAAQPKDQIPLEKLKRHLASCEDDRTPVVLISTGAYAPVHLMHFKVFDAAKAWLEERHPIRVVGGFMSPSHDDYVGPKMESSGVGHIRFPERLAMCDLAVRHSDWVDVSRWEGEQSTFVDFPTVAMHHHKCLAELFPRIKVMYLCGADHAIKCYLMNGLYGKIGVVAVGRPGYTRQLARLQTKEGLFYLVQTEMEDVSSTLIRKRLAEGRSVANLTGADVAEYLTEHGIDKLFQ